jgi:lysophospholipase L1-like esterase
MKLSSVVSSVFATSLALTLWGCGGGDGGLTNKDPGNNDVNVVVAFGDSITQGSECPCSPYPARLPAMIGKTVVNTGIAGSTAADNVSRTQSAIDKYHPGFMLILYGVNDVIHGHGLDTITSALDQMVSICLDNHVVPVLATYPHPITGHRIFGPRTASLNALIRDLASSRGVKCVDLESEFNMNPEWYMPDGLHPNDPGTQVMALAFADLF